jgi:hypothetical protein
MTTVYDDPAVLRATQRAAAHMRLTLLDDHAGANAVLADALSEPDLMPQFVWAISRYGGMVLTEATGGHAKALAQLDDLVARLHRSDRQEDAK